jgi:hypothetical protein
MLILQFLFWSLAVHRARLIPAFRALKADSGCKCFGYSFAFQAFKPGQPLVDGIGARNPEKRRAFSRFFIAPHDAAESLKSKTKKPLS